MTVLFNPSREDVRRFFCDTRRKTRAGEVLTPLESRAASWIDRHPEYHRLLDDPTRAVAEDFSVERDQSNPFLHLSLHLALDEQLSIDQPSGIRAVFLQLATRAGAEHQAAHAAMQCLGEIVWRGQRGTLPADAAAINADYLECLRRLVTA